MYSTPGAGAAHTAFMAKHWCRNTCRIWRTVLDRALRDVRIHRGWCDNHCMKCRHVLDNRNWCSEFCGNWRTLVNNKRQPKASP